MSDGTSKVRDGAPVKPTQEKQPTETAQSPHAFRTLTMSKFFINRPIVAMVISIVTVIVGLVSMLRLPIAQFPSIVPPEILGSGYFIQVRMP